MPSSNEYVILLSCDSPTISQDSEHSLPTLDDADEEILKTERYS